MMHTPRQTYHSYLLRLWRDGKGQPWRASLQSVATETTEHFMHVEAMFAFLMRQMETDAASASTSIQDSTQEDDHE